MAEKGGGAPVYPIGVVEKLTGLTGRRIRYYEETGLLKPERTDGNQRLYSSQDVARLKEVKRLLEEGLNLAGVKARLLELDERGGYSRPGAVTEPRISFQEENDVRHRMGREAALMSLYPVSNQAELRRVIEEAETGEEREQ